MKKTNSYAAPTIEVVELSLEGAIMNASAGAEISEGKNFGNE